jgi:hypothetical protein
MHVRAPHGRVAFGLGRLWAADPAVPTVVADDLDGSLAAGGGGCCCWGRKRRLLEEEAAAAAGGGGCGCWERRLLLREVAACPCCRWKEHCKDGRGLPAARLTVARRMASSRRPRSESAAWAGCVARQDRPFVDTHSQCACQEPEPVGGMRLGSTCQSSFVPLPGLGHAHYAEPVRGKRPGGACQSSFVPLPGLSHAHYAEPARGKRPGGTCQSSFVPLPGLGHAHYADPARGKRPGGTCQSSFVPLPGLSHAHYAEPARGKRPGGTCQSTFVPLPGLGHAHYADPVRGKRPGGTCQSVRWSVRVSAGSGLGPGQPGHGVCARQGQWQGPVLVGAAVAAGQCRCRASSESATMGHEWPHADGAPVGTVLEPLMRTVTAHAL